MKSLHIMSLLLLLFAVACSGQHAGLQEGEKLLKEEKYAEAKVKFEAAINAGSENPAAYTGRGRCRIAEGDFQGGLDDFNKATSLLSEGSTPEAKGNAFFYKGLGHFNLQDNAAAVEAFDKSIAAGGGDNLSMAHAYRGVCIGFLGDDIAAIGDLDKAIKIDPTNHYALTNRGYYNAKLGDNKGAINDLSRAVELQPEDIMSRLNRGYTYLQMGDFANARADFEACLAQDPNYFGALTYMGITLTNTGNNAEAIGYFDKAIAQHPDNPTLYYYRGSARIFLGQKEAGCADLKHSIENGDPQGQALYQDNCGG